MGKDQLAVGTEQARLDAETDASAEERRDRASRLWAHALHEDSDFGQRNNFFLLAESMLVVAYSGLLTSGLAATSGYTADKILLAARVIAGFGFLLTLVWVHVGRRQWLYTKHVFGHAAVRAPEAKVTRQSFKRGRFPGSGLMVYGVAFLAAAMWLIFFVLV